MPFGHKAGLPPSKKYLLMRQPLFYLSLVFLTGVAYNRKEKQKRGKDV